MASDAAAAPPISEELLEHLASGVDIVVATRDAALSSESMLAMGAKAHPDRRTITVYLPTAQADATLRNLEENGQIAITAIRPSTHKAVQLKGRFKAQRNSGPSDRELQLLQRAALVEDMAVVGVPRSATRRLVWWPSVAVDVEVDSVFAQTPGPNAGQPLARK